MTPEQFQQWADLLPEPMLLLDCEGKIMAANASASGKLAPISRVGCRLCEVAANPHAGLAEYLRACSRSRSPLPGAIILPPGEGEAAVLRCEGALLDTCAGGAERQILLRLVPKESAVRQFLALNQKLDELAAEIVRRRQVQRELRSQQERLQASEERLRLALEAGRMGTWDWDLATDRVVWSPGLERLHGVEPGTFPGTFNAYQEDIHPEDRSRVLAAIQYTLQEGTAHHIEYRLVWPDGSVHWVEARGRLFRDGAGKPVRMAGVCMDVDQRKLLERQLHDRLTELAETEQRVRSVVDHVVDAIITIDDRGMIQSANAAAERVFGYAAAEMVGRNVNLLMPEPDHSRHDEYIANYLRTGKAKVIGAGREVTGLRSDGTTFPMELGVSQFRLGERRYFTGIVRDITERKRDERVARFLADASRSLSTLVDYESTLQKVAHLAVPFFADWCAVHVADENGKLRQLAIAHADPQKVELAEALGKRYPPDPAASRGASWVFRTGQSELIAEIDEDLLQRAAADAEHLQILRALGLRSSIRVPLVVHNRNLGVISFVSAESGRRYDQRDLAVAEDLAHRAAVAMENARLYGELREADRRKDDFLAMLAHELRNPLAPIRSGLDLLAAAGAEAPVVELMKQQVEHLVRLVDDLLDVSRITRGKITLRREVVELAPIVQRAAETARPLIHARRHQLFVSLPPEPVWVEADPVRLAQALTNLLNNAAKYTDAEGRIDVVARCGENHLMLAVRDNGIGIKAEMLPKVFDLFTQADQSLERSQGGLGIGLTLVRSLVEMHGGSVSAASGGEGQGSEFVIHLPFHAPRLAAAAPPAALGDVPSRRILVVDDNVGAAKMLALLLTRISDHQVHTAHDGLSALEAARDHRPEIVLLDIGLPRMNGYEVARRLRQQPEFEQTVLVALTGYGSEDDRRRSIEAGFDEHLVKPPSLESLQRLAVHHRLVST